ncbi:hypothetical protein DYB31_010645 [Aphanomyces astaci]|uniref:Cyclin-like domain-containing protein n=1 Tax=Aphanomyces astaci TaxID=112090 RepID=A0A397EM73_APHAT|nr:hypothetical protein DYB31_010645 [Aphanomyces astaci]
MAAPLTPSQAEGLSATDEKRHRFYACELIQEAGILLQLPQVVLATAQSLLHRFYARQSLFDFDAFRAAMGCIFLASKAEEQPRRVKDVVQVFFRMRNRRMGLGLSLLMPSDPRFATWTDWLVMVERQVLIEVGFSIDGTTEHPHKFLLYYIKLLECSDACAQQAWNYVNDSFRLDLCLRYDAHVIACAAISLAARVLQHVLPLGWEELLEVDVPDVISVAREMLALYEHPRVRWLEPLTEVNPFEVTRHDKVEAPTNLPPVEHPAVPPQPPPPTPLVNRMQAPSYDDPIIVPVEALAETEIAVAAIDAVGAEHDETSAGTTTDATVAGVEAKSSDTTHVVEVRRN